MPKLIYILTNKSFNNPNWVKIGFTTNLQERIDTLSNTSLPYDYEAYATYEVPDSVDLADKTLHKLIAKLNPNLRLVPNKEFFAISPADAYSVLEAMAKIHGRENLLVRYKDGEMNFSDKYGKQIVKEYDEKYFLSKMLESTKNLYLNLKNKILSNFSDLTLKYTKTYISFLKNKHTVCDIEVGSRRLLYLFINIRHAQIFDPKKLCYDVSKVGHHGNGDWRVKLPAGCSIDIDDLIPLIKQSYDKK